MCFGYSINFFFVLGAACTHVCARSSRVNSIRSILFRVFFFFFEAVRSFCRQAPGGLPVGLGRLVGWLVGREERRKEVPSGRRSCCFVLFWLSCLVLLRSWSEVS